MKAMYSKYFIITYLLLFPFGLLAQVNPCIPDSAVPFNCTGLLYQTINNQLQVYDPVNQSSITVNPGDLNSEWLRVNAAGYNTNDNFIYAIGQTDFNDPVKYLVIIDATGEYYNCGSISNLVTTNVFFIGDMDLNNNLVLQRDNEIYLLDVTSTPLAVSGPYCIPINDYNDFTFNPVDGLLYALYNNGNTVVSIDYNNLSAPTSNCPNGSVTVNTICSTIDATGVTPNPTTCSAFGAQWFDVNGNLSVSCNSSGQYYEVDYTACVFAIPSGGGQGPTTGNNDGASCALASNPFCINTPTFGTFSAENNVCPNDDIILSIENIENNAAVNNIDNVNYGVSIVYFNSPTATPYNGGVVLATIPFESLSNNNTATNYTIPGNTLTDGEYYFYTIFDTPPQDADCLNSASFILNVNNENCLENEIVPTLGQWGLIILALLIIITGIVSIREGIITSNSI